MTFHLGCHSFPASGCPSSGDGFLGAIIQNGRDCHINRRREILRNHPEVRHLFGRRPATAGVACCVVAAQFVLATLVEDQPWWLILLASYGLGAFCMHYLHVVIHECAHNLVFKKTALNKACAILANLPSVVPSAIGFRHYHLLHHRFLGQSGLDSDLAPRWEAKLIGRGWLGKLIWVMIQPFTYAIVHPLHIKEHLPFDRWVITNILFVAAAAGAVLYWFGAASFAYLALSTYFAVGPHPTGAHILQEHIIFKGCYETASYYGPVNAISMNHGLHVEHHDFPNVPGARLCALRWIAPRYYGDSFYHRSRFATLWHFIFDRHIGLDTRVIHRSEAAATDG